MEMGEKDKVIDFFFSEESKHLFNYDGMTEERLGSILLDGWEYIEFPGHMTAYKEVEPGVAEVHTYTTLEYRAHALTYLQAVTGALSIKYDYLVTFVPSLFQGTINFLTKRLGFVNLGVSATSVIDDKPTDIYQLIRRL
jgi:hypothetical protein